MSDEELMRHFEDCTLKAECFHHADHVRLAYLYVCRYPLLQAIERYSMALQKFATAQGKPERYHETITWAYMFLLAERRARAEHPETWENFAHNNPDLLNWQENILKHYYRDDTLKSVMARKIFIFPDKLFREPLVQ
jgi:hypothetical protein